MSERITMEVDSYKDGGFTIKSMCGCRLVFGHIPVSEFGILTHGFSNNAQMAIDIASRIGATLVIGEPKDLDALRKLDLPVSEKRLCESEIAAANGLPYVAKWLRDGDRGASSDAMCKRIFGVPESAGTDHPRDPSDLGRCLGFIEATGAHNMVLHMSDVSKKWASLVSIWGELVETYRSDTEKQKTYELMKKAMD